MAAHNLREPLRDVASFSQLMAETYAGRLGFRRRRIARTNPDGARQECSRCWPTWWPMGDGTGDRQPSRRTWRLSLARRFSCADRQIAERNAIVTHDPLPEVRGRLRNADQGPAPSDSKCHRILRRTAPRVHISSRRVDPDWVFSVQDNGPGIEAAFMTASSSVFKRLHGREYPGNGLGLAYCRKAIERLGGRIWLESTAGAGSTFYFTLPPAGLKRNPSVTPTAGSGNQKFLPHWRTKLAPVRPSGWSFWRLYSQASQFGSKSAPPLTPVQGNRLQGFLLLEPPHERRFQGVTVSGFVVV